MDYYVVLLLVCDGVSSVARKERDLWLRAKCGECDREPFDFIFQVGCQRVLSIVGLSMTAGYLTGALFQQLE
jgi:hypothetical protein